MFWQWMTWELLIILWGDHWPRPVREGDHSQSEPSWCDAWPIRSHFRTWGTKSSLTWSPEPLTPVAYIRHLELRSDKEPCSGMVAWVMMLSESFEGSLHSWSDLSWPVATSNPISPQASLHCCDSDDAVSHQPHMDQGWNYGVRNLFITIAASPCLYWC